jgi:hypothetical protein
MKQLLIFVLKCLYIILFLIGCKGIVEPVINNEIRGKVVDPIGNPVEDAIIELSFHTNPPYRQLAQYINTTNFLKIATVTIRFSVPTQTHIKLWITRKNSTENIRTLIDRQIEAGYYSWIWDLKNNDGKSVISSIYTYHIDYGYGYYLEKDLFLDRQYSNNDSIPGLEYCAITNSGGVFSIPQDILPFDEQFNITDAEGNLIGIGKVINQVKVWALYKDYSVTFQDNVFVDPELGARITLQFQ